MMRSLHWWLLLGGLVWVTGFSGSLGAESVAPEKLDDGWLVAAPAETHMRAEPLEEMRAKMADGTYKNLHGAVLVRNGRLVLEGYFKGRNAEDKEQDYTRETLHSVQSVTKSVTSILIGIAIDEGLIHGVDEKLARFFPQEAELFVDKAKAAIALKDCLSMTAGLEWKESGIPYTDAANDVYGMNRSEDPVREVLKRPSVARAGEKFVYHTGISVLLGEALHQAASVPADEFAARHLFGPLGIKDWRWGRLKNGVVHTGGGLWLRPRDMAKIGQLYLDGGRWQGKQVVGEGWVRDSITQQTPYKGYGYQWWLRSFRGRTHELPAFAAQGLGGQFIIVMPELQLVAVFTGWNIGPLVEQPMELMQRFVIPAAEDGGK